MKSVLLLVSIIAVFFVASRLAPTAVIAAVVTIAWGLVFGIWLGIGLKKQRRGFFRDNDFAVNPLDTDASPGARALASFRDDD